MTNKAGTFLEKCNIKETIKLFWSEAYSAWNTAFFFYVKVYTVSTSAISRGSFPASNIYPECFKAGNFSQIIFFHPFFPTWEFPEELLFCCDGIFYSFVRCSQCLPTTLVNVETIISKTSEQCCFWVQI